MSLLLPAELLNEVLRWATAGEEPDERQTTRNRFRLVCRGWNESFSYWNEVHVGQVRRLRQLVNLMAAEDDPTRLNLQRANLQLGTSGSIGDRREALGSFFQLATGLTSVRLATGYGDTLAEPLVSGVCFALTKLRSLRHFAWEGSAPSAADMMVFEPDYIQALVSSWPELETLSLINFHFAINTVAYKSKKPGPLSTCNALTSLTITGDARGNSNWETLLSDCPAKLRILSLDWRTLLGAPPPAVLSKIAALAGTLTQLTITDCAWFGASRSISVRRGSFDDVLPRLTQLRRLTTGPCAVKHLSAILGRLQNLAFLELRSGAARTGAALRRAEVVDFVACAPALRHIGLCERTCADWSAEDRIVVEDAATARRVEVLWLGVST